MGPDTAWDVGGCLPERPVQELLGLARWEGLPPGEGLLMYRYVCLLSVRSRRDLEIERPMPGTHTVTLQ